MMTRLRAILVHCAIALIAIQTVLAGFAPGAAAQPTLDPFAVICHSGGADETAPSDQTGGRPQTCDHCVLCNVTAAADVPNTVASLAPLVVATEFAVLLPALALSGLYAGFNFARGPPPTA